MDKEENVSTTSNTSCSTAGAVQGLTIDNAAERLGIQRALRMRCHISVDTFLKKGEDVNRKDETGLTPLHEACMLGSYPVVKILLNMGADANIEDNNGLTPILVASIFDLESIVELLLDSGARVNSQCQGLTPLHLASYSNSKNNLQFVNLLLENKANVNMIDACGDTPLHEAAVQYNYEIAERLLEKGAQIDVRNNNNVTPYDKVLIRFRTRKDIKGVKTKAVLEIHILKLKMAGLPLNIHFHRHINGYVDVKSKCLEELEKMRNTKILDNFSLKHLISKFERPWFLRNPVIFGKLEEIVYSPEFLEAFPLYAHILINTFEKSKQRFELLDGASQSFTGGFENLPELMKMEILDYLSNDDLQNIMSVFEERSA